MQVQKYVAIAAAALIAGCNGSFGQIPGSASAARSARYANGSSPIQHIVIVLQENRSFDNMFHGFPGANTVDSGAGHGKRYQLQEIPLKWTVYDLNHSHTQFLEDYDQGKDDGFDSEITPKFKQGPGCSDPINHPACWVIYKTPKFQQMAYSYVKQSDVQPYWTMAQQYALGDNAFPSNNGPTYVSHQYLIAGESGHASEVPNGQPWGCGAQQTGPNKVTVELLEYGQADPPVFSKATGHEVDGPFPCFTYTTIADSLDAAGISWRYYVEGAGSGANLSAFMAIKKIYHGPDWKNVKSPDTAILKDIANNNLAQVSWVMPSGHKSDHPGPQSGNLGPSWVASIVNAVGQSPYWSNTAIVVMWDDWGGWYDHVHPPQYPDPQTKAREGLGFRVPLIVVSPYAKPDYISHQQHEIASTLRFIEETFALPFLGAGSGNTYADRRADGFDDMFDFTQKPIQFKPIPSKQKASYFLTHRDDTPADRY
ncbi:MAG TPA: alkaline phosphatase family protein [Candidatus Tumulicola sp.]|jgi:phospholipase C